MDDAPRLRSALDAVPAYLAGRAAPAGAYKLSSNETPFPPLPGVVAAILDAAGQVNRYPDFRSSRLVAALAARHGVGEDQVAVGTGSVGVAQQVAQATAGAGDEVVFGWRSFEAYPIIVQVCGATAVTVPLRPDESHDLPAMAEAVGPRTRLVLLCSPNNPTGTAVRRAELDRFLTEVPDDVVVVLDEAYREFVRDPDVPDGVELLREHANLVVLRTFSKAYGLAGLRVGYAVASPVVAAALRKTQVPFGVSSVAEQAALAALAAQAEVERRVQAVVDERVRVLERLRDLGLSGHDTQGNFVWLRLGGRTADMAQACLDSGVVVRPFAGEGLRVTVGEPAANDAFLAVVEGTLARSM